MTQQVKRVSYKPLWWLIALCAFPYVAGGLYYQFYELIPQSKTFNYGALVEPVREVTGVEFQNLDGSQFAIDDLRGKWVMLYWLDGSCDEQCQQTVYYMRQVRKAMGQDRFRISRLLLVENPQAIDAQTSEFLSNFPGLQIASVTATSRAQLEQKLSVDGQEIRRKIMLFDPIGNFMMHYPVELEAKPFLKDVKRLLSVSRIG